ncbi:YkvA family protein [Cognatilysobacter terrigena]|uniref:YkvA family protein n=1 Tax=Cognatilysobacter terrigena TaxID=2488749 RepID=UPI0010619AA9|nr:YkvA family protein [Lysobacter terrigena]
MSWTTHLRGWARSLKQQTLVVYFAARDPRTPWAVRLAALAVAAYALSPIDLIPDFIPVLGYLDDVIIVPLGIALVMRWTPADVKADAHARAAVAATRPTSRGMAAVIVAIWVVVIALLAWWGYGLWSARRA